LNALFAVDRALPKQSRAVQGEILSVRALSHLEMVGEMRYCWESWAPFASCGRAGEHSMIEIFDCVLSLAASESLPVSAGRPIAQAETRRPAAERPCL
jgi:hypothetical protein